MAKSSKKDIFIGIKVLGLGGSGSNIVNRIYRERIRGIEFFALNTDLQALRKINGPKKIQIGKNTCRGLGTGMDPEFGRQSAEESKNEIEEILKGAQMIFITCGLGGGTASGALPVVAEIAKNLGILTIAIVTTPFSFEGKIRKEIAEKVLEELKNKVDALITVSNDRLLSLVNKETSLFQSFSLSDNILKNAILGISDLIISPGLINIDFADIKTIMENSGQALMGIGQASGEEKAVLAAKEALENPLLSLNLAGAKNILFSIKGGKNLTLYEVNEAAKIITQNANDEAKIIFGAVIDENLKEEIEITVIISGLTKETEEKKEFISLVGEQRESFKKVAKEIEEEKTKAEKELEIPAFLRKKIKY